MQICNPLSTLLVIFVGFKGVLGNGGSYRKALFKVALQFSLMVLSFLPAKEWRRLLFCL